MSDALFPSGPWIGFYNYVPADKHWMDLELTFTGGKLTGSGRDDVGAFTMRGGYDVKTLDCSWIKSYPGSHDVFYRGFREGKGIWGAWEIGRLSHGGFHIWPRAAGEEREVREAEATAKPVEAVAVEVAPQSGARGCNPVGVDDFF